MLRGVQLGKALDKARKIKGCTKNKLAADFGVTSETMHSWIGTGRIEPGQIADLMEYFADYVGSEHWGVFPSGESKPSSKINESVVLNTESRQKESTLKTATISLQEDDWWTLTNIVQENKKKKTGPKSLSALVLASLRECGHLS